MKTVPFLFFLSGALCALIGMGWGIKMSMSHDHLLSPAHAHLNLVGWVTLALFGTFYHLVPSAAETLLAKIHLALAVAGVVIMAPGIAIAISGGGEALAALGSILTIRSMLIFDFTVATRGRAA